MSKATETDRKAREAIVDLLAYCAVFSLSLNEDQIVWYLPVKANIVGVKTHIAVLIKRGKIYRLPDKTYGVKKGIYNRSKASQVIIATNLKRALRFSRLFRLLPFVKAVVLSSDSILQLDNPDVNLQYIFVTLPGRIYITKGVLYYFLGGIGKRRNSKNQHKSVYLNMFYTTSGVRFSDKMGACSIDQVLWFILAQPLYGEKVWFSLLQKDTLVYASLPNYPWRHAGTQIYTTMSRYIDKLDNQGYRRHLRHVADQPEFHGTQALLRVRPDTLIARPNHKLQIKTSELYYKEIRSKIK